MTATDEARIAGDLLAALQARLGAPELTYAEQPRRLAGGRETTLCSFELAGLPERDALAGPLVLRLISRDYPRDKALWEGAVQNAAASGGYPAPRVFVAESEPRVAGQSYVVMEKLRGGPLTGTMVSDLDRTAALTVRARMRRGATVFGGVARELPVLARTLATHQLRLHAVDPKPLVEQLQSGVLRPGLVRVDGWVDEMASIVADYDLAGLRKGLAWLRAERSHEATPVIAHGDFGPHNLLVDRGEITGVIDWSYARLAEPEFDVGNTLALMRLAVGFLPGAARAIAAAIAEWLVRRYLRIYRSARPLDPERLRYHEALRTCRELCTLARWRLRNRAEPRAANAWDPAGDHLEARFRKLTGVAASLPAR